LLSFQITREKIIRFFAEGSKRLKACEEMADRAPYNWTILDHELFNSATTCAVKSMAALVGSNEDSKSFDLDGPACLTEMLSLVDAGHDYINRTKCGEHSPVPLEEALNVLRKLLSTLGFTQATSKAGLDSAEQPTSNVVGGEVALAEILSTFREEIRSIAIRQMKISNTSDDRKANATELLKICDDARNASSVAGLELLDSKVDSADGDNQKLKWRWCRPNQKTDDSKIMAQNKEKKPRKLSSRVPVHDLFRVGSYEGVYSEYDAIGMPTTNADGTPVSKSALKKLKKKREKYERKLEIGDSYP